jgi:hypothetical protein
MDTDWEGEGQPPLPHLRPAMETQWGYGEMQLTALTLYGGSKQEGRLTDTLRDLPANIIEYGRILRKTFQDEGMPPEVCDEAIAGLRSDFNAYRTGSDMEYHRRVGHVFDPAVRVTPQFRRNCDQMAQRSLRLHLDFRDSQGIVSGARGTPPLRP